MFECVRDLAGRPIEDIAENEHGSLARRKYLQGADEGESDALPLDDDNCRVGARYRQHCVREWLEPRLVQVGDTPLARVGAGSSDRRPQVLWQDPPLATLEQVQACIGSDTMQPRTKRCALVEGLEAAPGLQRCLLDCVLGIVERTKHAVAEDENLARLRLDQPAKRILVTQGCSCDERTFQFRRGQVSHLVTGLSHSADRDRNTQPRAGAGTD
jgi:hypothetical protein